MKKLMILASLLLVLAGCGSKGKEVTTVCSLNSGNQGTPGFMELVQTLNSRGDDIYKMTTATRIEAPSKEELDDSMDLFQSMIDESVKIEGVEGSVNRESDTVVGYSIAMDFDKIPDEEFVKLGITDADSKKISLKKMVADLEVAGFACTTE